MAAAICGFKWWEQSNVGSTSEWERSNGLINIISVEGIPLREPLAEPSFESSDDPRKTRSPKPPQIQESSKLRQTCPHCFAAFATKGDLFRHSCIPRDFFRFRCNRCGTLTASQASFSKHSSICGADEEKSTPPKPKDPDRLLYKCHQCSKSFGKKSWLKHNFCVHGDTSHAKHQKLNCAPANQDVFCSIQGAMSASEDVVCTSQDAVSTSQDVSPVQEDKSSPPKPKDPDQRLYKCHRCSKSFGNKSWLKRHFCIHRDTADVLCRKLNGTPANQDVFCSIQDVVPASKDVVCTSQDAVSTSQDVSPVQKDKSSPPKPKDPDQRLYKCHRCSKSFGNKSWLKRHLCIHRDTADLLCRKLNNTPANQDVFCSIQDVVPASEDVVCTNQDAMSISQDVSPVQEDKSSPPKSKDPDQRLYKCHRCSKSFGNKSWLKHNFCVHGDTSHAKDQKLNCAPANQDVFCSIQGAMSASEDVVCTSQDAVSTSQDVSPVQEDKSSPPTPKDPDQRLYKCHRCSKSFGNKSWLKRHFCIHRDTADVLCRKLNGTPANQDVFCSIQDVVPASKDVVCTSQDAVSTSQDVSPVQEDKSSPPKPKDPDQRLYKCHRCSKSFGNKSWLKRHLCIYRDTADLLCRKLNGTPANQDVFCSIQDVVPASKDVVCTSQDAVSTSQDVSPVQEDKSSPPKPKDPDQRLYKCHRCSKSFGNKSWLKRHLCIYRDTADLLCRKLNGTPANQDVFCSIQDVVPASEDVVCTNQDAMSTSQDVSPVQEDKSSPPKPKDPDQRLYKCHRCSKSFGNKSWLKRHLCIYRDTADLLCGKLNGTPANQDVFCSIQDVVPASEDVVCTNQDAMSTSKDVSPVQEGKPSLAKLKHPDQCLHKCHRCSKSFGKKSWLKRHFCIHRDTADVLRRKLNGTPANQDVFCSIQVVVPASEDVVCTNQDAMSTSQDVSPVQEGKPSLSKPKDPDQRLGKCHRCSKSFGDKSWLKHNFCVHRDTSRVWRQKLNGTPASQDVINASQDILPASQDVLSASQDVMSTSQNVSPVHVDKPTLSKPKDPNWHLHKCHRCSRSFGNKSWLKRHHCVRRGSSYVRHQKLNRTLASQDVIFASLDVLPNSQNVFCASQDVTPVHRDKPTPPRPKDPNRRLNKCHQCSKSGNKSWLKRHFCIRKVTSHVQHQKLDGTLTSQNVICASQDVVPASQDAMSTSQGASPVHQGKRILPKPKNPDRHLRKCHRCWKSFENQSRLEHHFCVFRDTSHVRLQKLNNTSARQDVMWASQDVVCASQGVAPASQAAICTSQDVVPASYDIICTSQSVAPANQYVSPASQNAICASQDLTPATKDVIYAIQDVALGSQDAICTNQNVTPASQDTTSTSQDAALISQEVAPANKDALCTSQGVAPTNQDDIKERPSIESEKEMLYTCNQCNESYSKETQLATHMRVHAGSNRYRCKDCTKTFVRKFGLQVHMLTHTGERPFKCQLCPKGFTRKVLLRLHGKVHAEQKYKCNLCPESFQRKMSLNKHKRMHAPPKRFPCDCCLETFASVAELRVHVRVHAPEYRCTECGKSFDRKGPLAIHMVTHTGEKPHSCNICPKRFSQKVTLTVHLRSHANDRKYKCEVCDMMFLRKQVLERHMVVHTGERKYACEHCPKRFAQKATLLIHERTHSGERPHACTICEKRFTTRTNLERHVTTHTGERPFKCWLCPAAFATNSTLKGHVQTHKRAHEYKCVVCKLVMYSRKGLSGHMKRHVRKAKSSDVVKVGVP